MNPEAIPPALPSNRSSKRPSFLGYAGAPIVGAIGFLFIWAVTFEMTRKDTETDYVFMCEHLFKPLPMEGETQITLPGAMVESLLQEERDQLAHISWHDKKLAPIARHFSDLISHAQHLDENPPRFSPVIFGSAEAALGLYSGQRKFVGDGGTKLLNAAENLWDAVQARKNLFDDRDDLAVRLATLTRNFCGPITKCQLITASFTDQVPGFLQSRTRHSLGLTNTSGRELHNCVIGVFFSNAAGKSCLNLYFVQDWDPGEERVATYSDVFDFPRDTVDNITEVDIGFASKECSQEPFATKRPYNGWPSTS
ncbi:MAG TPA: hypothetical protein VGJ73_09470 [Verrucomicrobiae bacterium]|jgi:hypothetical protein